MTPRQVRKYCTLRPECLSMLSIWKNSASRPEPTTRSSESPGRWPTSKGPTPSSPRISPSRWSPARSGRLGVIDWIERRVDENGDGHRDGDGLEDLEIAGRPARIARRDPRRAASGSVRKFGTATEADLIEINARKKGISGTSRRGPGGEGNGIHRVVPGPRGGGLPEGFRDRSQPGIVTGADGMMRLFPGLVRAPDAAFASGTASSRSDLSKGADRRIRPRPGR